MGNIPFKPQRHTTKDHSVNVGNGNFTLQCEENWMSLITRMLSRSSEEHPTIEECLQAVTRLMHQSDYTGTTSNSGNVTTEQQVSLSDEEQEKEQEQEEEPENSTFSC